MIAYRGVAFLLLALVAEGLDQTCDERVRDRESVMMQRHVGAAKVLSTADDHEDDAVTPGGENVAVEEHEAAATPVMQGEGSDPRDAVGGRSGGADPGSPKSPRQPEAFAAALERLRRVQQLFPPGLSSFRPMLIPVVSVAVLFGIFLLLVTTVRGRDLTSEAMGLMSVPALEERHALPEGHSPKAWRSEGGVAGGASSTLTSQAPSTQRPREE